MYRHDIEQLVTSVPELLAENTGLRAFRKWFADLAEYIRVKHGLGEALRSPAAQEAIRGTYAPVIAGLDELIRACVSEGSMRKGLLAADVLPLMGFYWRAPADAEDANRRSGLWTSSWTVWHPRT